MQWIKGTKKNDKWNYCSECICLDVETSHDEEMCWISTIQLIWLGKYYFFRKPTELMQFYIDLYNEYDLADNDRRIVTYIHNAAYDLSYLVGFFKAFLPGRSFTRRDGNKIYKYSQGNLEWRCSYRLTNLALDKWAKQMNCSHSKLTGFYDYSKIIYQDTPLTEEEKAYAEEDVRIMEECLAKQLEMFGDNMYSIPSTATGYVRRDIRKSCLKNKFYRKDVLLNTKLSYRQFRYCLKAFAGGYTHCNRHYRDKLITGHIKHRDFKSHYPSILRDKKFPMGKPKTAFDFLLDKGKTMTIPEVLALSPQYTTVSVIGIRNIHVKSDSISMPFLQESRLFIHSNDIMAGKPMKETMLRDNGRVLTYIGHKGDDKYIDGRRYIIVDNCTLRILWEQYNWEDYFVIHVTKFENDYLPEEVLAVVDKYFKDKTHYKKLERIAREKYGETSEMALNATALLLCAKQLFNSISGCICTNPIKSLDEDELDEDESLTESYEKKLERYYDSYYSVLPYQWAMMITAYGRYMLYECIKLIGYDKVLYADTDSLFYLSDDDTEAAIDLYNKMLRKDAHYIDINGIKEYYSSFDEEPDLIAFKGLHSKCYGYVTEKKHELVLTIAGVPKRTCVGIDKDKNPIYVSREDELANGEKDKVKALDHLNDTFSFKINTGTTAEYITLNHPVYYETNGHTVETCGGCIVRKLPEKKINESHVDKYEGPEDPTFNDVMIF